MATPQETPPPPYPSYTALIRERKGRPVTINECMDRLFWPLEGVFPSCVSVMRHPRGSKEALQPFFNPDNSNSSGSWHACASEPLTEPKVSSISVSCLELEQWEADWVAWHDDSHHESRREFVAYADLEDDIRPFRREGVEDGEWEEEEVDDDEKKQFLIRCCGQDRPVRKKGQTLLITASGEGEGEGFVTVRDFVGSVHPWLLNLHDDLIKAKSVARWEAFPESAGTRWMVNYRGLTSSAHGGEVYVLVERGQWIRDHGPLSPVAEGHKARFLDRIRKNREERNKG
ncbi:hypothetical protein F5Y17DRAFT_454510 [Xylariaceae sp. FL0594]|nr:hypothetical protein F5Y17DRAFT_454510 [Xylariaceae sp. FL0594]